MALANAWGFFLVICLLGYGLVNVPRLVWTRADYDGMLARLEAKASRVHDKMTDAMVTLSDTKRVRITHSLGRLNCSGGKYRRCRNSHL